MTIKELRTLSGMTQKVFAEYFGFSKRAVESWEGGKRDCPDYLVNLIKYKLENEGIIKKGEQS
jgi:DNA-binding transcriptional regulator YiaG